MMKFVPTKWEGVDGMGEAELNKLRKPAERAVKRASIYFVSAVKKTLTGPRTGRIYRIGRRGRLHQASAPGEPPAVMRGKLRQSITATEPQWEGNNVSSETGSNQPQARRLEWGGVDSRGVRILPRPYFEPTWQREMTMIEQILEETTR